MQLCKLVKLIPRLKSGGFRGHRELGIGHWPMHECPLPQDDGRQFLPPLKGTGFPVVFW
ncbi:hypothetical protein QUB80_00770 [Chlorogloeopsis sp. ULAP01]|uniref:hypothetical protein n=1 Tax=Chlorogloeopsis sp. ULAP01 TaxID=3056483 RepID=UPI0025AA68E0|nr:hypothetical protein [Chlorogloeopsis sp. ULAP01]MDM9379240.1 hypothetical protein [Chlorogloeopsis sp. ULAP01]